VPDPRERRERLQGGIDLREAGHFEDACAELGALHADVTPDAEVAYHAAWAHDRAGLEREALPYYEEALAGRAALSEEERFGVFLGLGSSYRLVGRFEDSARVLERGVAEHPDRHVLVVFLAITRLDAGAPDASARTLLTLLASQWDDAGVQDYRRPILEYAAGRADA
jgi:hypothetical protein